MRLLALRESPTAFGSSYEEEQTRSVAEVTEALHAGLGQHLLGAAVGQALVGMARLERETSAKEQHRASLRSMYVRPTYRRAGIGRVLVQAQLDAARALPGLRQITLAVTAGNTAAITLYESCGFRSYGVAPEALYVDGRYFDEILMVLHLQSERPGMMETTS